MCNVFSGLIVTKKDKDWGKVLFLSGVHHEKDREQVKDKYGDNVLAWESITPYSLDKFKFTHTLNIDKNEQSKLMKLIEQWAKKQDKGKLFRSMITVIKDNKQTEKYQIMDNTIKLENNMSLVCDFTVFITADYKSTLTAGDYSTLTAGDYSTLTAGYKSTLTAGDRSTLTADYKSTLTAGYKSTLTAGDYSTLTADYKSTLTAGDRSTLTAGYKSTLTAGDYSVSIVHGDTCYIVLKGKNVILRQIWYENNKYKSVIVNIDVLFKKYKVGDKVKIVKGKWK